jgi:hypothetical protein
MKSGLDQLLVAIEPYKKAITQHKVYSLIQQPQHLHIFMQYHVYAVWDFMSLLKSLQNELTCTTIPWFPKGNGDTRFLINEIVVGEESDVDDKGIRKSHFEIYLEAMQQCGADTRAMETFLHQLTLSGDVSTALANSSSPIEAQSFVNFTFQLIESKKDYLQSAIFTFGREDLIPDMFYSIIQDLHGQAPEKISLFKYYLERHIEVDGGHHSQLALQMTSQLCGNDPQKWEEAEAAVIEALKQRIQLWDGVYNQLVKLQETKNEIAQQAALA